MNCCLNKSSLAVIQGDTLDVTVDIENPDELVLTRVVFICPSLDIQKELTKLNDPTEEDNMWGFILPAQDTKNLRVGDWNFNIAAISDDSEVFTVVFKGVLHVEYNRSKNIGPVPPINVGFGWTED